MVIVIRVVSINIIWVNVKVAKIPFPVYLFDVFYKVTVDSNLPFNIVRNFDDCEPFRHSMFVAETLQSGDEPSVFSELSSAPEIDEQLFDIGSLKFNAAIKSFVE